MTNGRKAAAEDEMVRPIDDQISNSADEEFDDTDDDSDESEDDDDADEVE